MLKFLNKIEIVLFSLKHNSNIEIIDIKETPCCLYQNLEINNEETKEIVNNSEK